MATAFRFTPDKSLQERSFTPALVMMAAAVVVALMAAVLNSDFPRTFPYLFLLPWIMALFAVLLVPTLVLHNRGKLTLTNPLVWATWSYFFPAFVIGGIMLTAGWSQPYFLPYIQDANYNLPYTVVLVMLGHAGLALGYFSPFGERAGRLIGSALPTADHQPRAMIVPGLLLLVLGVLNSIAALVVGVFGYQRAAEVEAYDGIIFLTTLFWMQGTFLLWFVIFREKKFTIQTTLLMALLFLTSIGKALFSGGRSGLMQVFIIVTLAFLLSGRKLNFKKSVMAGTILGVCLVLGMIYGTTFRNIKGSESQVSLDRYTENIFDTFDQVGRFDLQYSMELAFTGLAERLDTLSSVAVVVSNYEQLQPYEESYGLDNNIWKDISTFFIPRVIWNEKPVASEARKYSELYFDYGENSFAITPIGDLVRNYGPAGVPIGMFLFGIVIRVMYRSLIEGQPAAIWRITLYFMLLMSISYEGFYGQLIPFMFKVGITTLVGIAIAGLIASSLGHRKTAGQP